MDTNKRAIRSLVSNDDGKCLHTGIWTLYIEQTKNPPPALYQRGKIFDAHS